ncbi:glycoside hydrolase family 3 C-terminal domain-containing protein [Actinomyces sp.]|uniref:glycoside hydrolase family 3 C-terminal domain-containing protein n=1 Tax=Actinomyces sp. TaxID=29317 RepID=UPI0026DA70E0|nr:glycoside hydrolase family 3 C-terminal domain-containing protein [Actinomyces sp.]MDO4900610.1 glycoside hydrolase family 3 C-terminal domain-containing protein [Actinomyces sp.]
MTVTASELTLLEAAALLSGASEWDSRSLPQRGIPSFVLSDGPHGVRRQLGSGDHLGIAASEPATCFPTAATVANSWDPSLAERMGQALGQEALALGVDVLLGPGMNIKRSPLCGRNFEYYSEDPILTGRMAAGLVRGIQSQGVAATPKHFAVNGQELRRMASDSVVDEATMREIYLTAFEIVVREAYPRALMSSYNRVNGIYANEHPHLLTEILRQEWGFTGLVVSDWGGSNDAAAAAAAGSSLEMPAPGLHSAREVVAAVEEGRISRDAVYARAGEVIAMAASAPSAKDPRAGRPSFDVDAHHRLARRVAEESIVLLRNQDAILPLAAGTRVAVVGDMASTPRYQGSGSSQINPTRLETTLKEIAGTGLELVGYAQGYDRQGRPDEPLLEEAVALAGRAEVVLAYIGLDELSESEGLDRSHMRLPQVQTRLLEALAGANPNVVAVVSAGSAVETEWEAHTRAVVHTSLSGQAGASATLRVLTGEVNPSGRLAETYPVRYEDNPTSAWFPATGELALYRDGPYVGYRYYNSTGTPVAHPFGFGLSYSSFDYADLAVDEGGAHLTITNNSAVDGTEVVQLYVTAPEGVWGPARELKGFAKVPVAAGETAAVTIPFDDYTFRRYSAAEDRWVRPAGTWVVRVGRNVEDLPLTAQWEVDGDPVVPGDPALGHYLDGAVAEVADAEFAALLGRPVPQPDSSARIGRNSPISDLAHGRSRIGRTAVKVLERRKAKADASGKPDLNILFMLNMPLRAMGKMTGGMVSEEMVGGIVDFCNGRALRGLRTIVAGFFRNRRQDKVTRRRLDSTR